MPVLRPAYASPVCGTRALACADGERDITAEGGCATWKDLTAEGRFDKLTGCVGRATPLETGIAQARSEHVCQRFGRIW